MPHPVPCLARTFPRPSARVTKELTAAPLVPRSRRSRPPTPSSEVTPDPEAQAQGAPGQEPSLGGGQGAAPMRTNTGGQESSSSEENSFRWERRRPRVHMRCLGGACVLALWPTPPGCGRGGFARPRCETLVGRHGAAGMGGGGVRTAGTGTRAAAHVYLDVLPPPSLGCPPPPHHTPGPQRIEHAPKQHDPARAHTKAHAAPPPRGTHTHTIPPLPPCRGLVRKVTTGATWAYHRAYAAATYGTNYDIHKVGGWV